MTGPIALQSPLLAEAPGVRHAFFTRQGGVSEGIYASLNVGLGSKDDPDAVIENRARCAAHFGARTIVTAYQVHSAEARIVDGPWPGEAPQADGVVTATPGVAPDDALPVEVLMKSAPASIASCEAWRTCA